jgi:acyl-CoA synthetase (AMP-forming)/AMP-acid ligase II
VNPEQFLILVPYLLIPKFLHIYQEKGPEFLDFLNRVILQIMLRGRNIFQGYLNDEEKSAEALDDDGWLHTGDIGYIDNDGFVHVSGRIKVLSAYT